MWQPEKLFTDKDFLQQLNTIAFKRHLDADAVLMQPGDIIQFVPIVLSGSIRVILQNTDGDEYFLYHIYPGETCAMTLTCCQSNKRSEIKAIAEEDVDLLMVPVSKMDEWSRYPEWKKFVSDINAQRFTELLETISLIAFTKLDEQVWNYLVKRVQATGNTTLHITHQQIANELNSPREVVTRLLHQLQKQNRVVLSRNLVEVQPFS